MSKLSMSRMGIHVIFKYLQPYGDFLDGNKSILPKYNNIDGDGLRLLQDLAYVKTFLMVKAFSADSPVESVSAGTSAGGSGTSSPRIASRNQTAR